jgi:hypothetical protein
MQELRQPRPCKPFRPGKLTAVSHRITSLQSDIPKYIRSNAKVKPFFECESALVDSFPLTD